MNEEQYYALRSLQGRDVCHFGIAWKSDMLALKRLGYVEFDEHAEWPPRVKVTTKGKQAIESVRSHRRK